MSRLIPASLSQVLFQPQKLRGLHFHRHHPADILEDAVLGLVDPIDLTDCSMVQPHDDISMGILFMVDR